MPFFKNTGPYALQLLAEKVGAEIARGDAATAVGDVASLGDAAAGDISFYANLAYRSALENTAASAVITRPGLSGHVPEGPAILICKDPSVAFETIVRMFYPDAGTPRSIFMNDGVSPDAHVHETARIEDGAFVEPGAAIGANAQIGAGTRIMPGAVIGANVCIGRDCSIGANASVLHAFLGDRVVLHPGVRIGQDGFGYSPGATGLNKTFQVGKVVVQNDVEIGANTCIDRGAVRDTMIGEGTKIDNLVQVGHNSVIGRHCAIAGLVAIAGSVTIGDGVLIGGMVTINNHARVSSGVTLLALSAVRGDIDEPGHYAGVPARPAREWKRELLAMQRMVREHVESSRKKASAEEKE
ncbi:MAG: UDP-3-O-(3-hydroxymyristoyl)glucosamine N-acyltransferase [Rhodobiaceae bacterium]|nr:UDP-3-O-(3-hydroxymyristoyl)glucosamine N-acyltransferase [Rhodobiaceae bacterium]MCC0013094.1 UDP-3-O-(3-hydroxymyristoyl)glucosamine N-acyltransferase [Rhodobiaceae bacterium]MCC0019236.1 UDP-3-O-(3-hydroxymyristoyl)glucosamine N-acyltransferase [Rhodobiaceae bacterium]MCC0062291.1 UDP-3-O-(3-hydroxymyristoyl)glucosamine N-acyltransferase [Rhodobiaceae bacterium]